MNSIISESVDTPMFSLKSKYLLEKPIHKYDFIKYSPSSLATINQIKIIQVFHSAYQEKMHTYVYKTHI